MDTPRMYTQEEAEHLIAREVAKQRMADIERNISHNESKVNEGFAEVKAQMNALSDLIRNHNLHVDRCRDNLREEIERDFATKMDLANLTNKVDAMWLKITVIVSSVMATGMVLQYFLVIAKEAKGLVGG